MDKNKIIRVVGLANFALFLLGTVLLFFVDAWGLCAWNFLIAPELECNFLPFSWFLMVFSVLALWLVPLMVIYGGFGQSLGGFAYVAIAIFVFWTIFKSLKAEIGKRNKKGKTDAAN